MASTMDSLRSFLFTNPISATIGDAVNSFSERRAKLGLSNPGTVENITREVQRDALLNNYMFTGLKADLTKALSINPLFQVSHQFAMGERLYPYTFAALYGTGKVRLALSEEWSISKLTDEIIRCSCREISTMRASFRRDSTTDGPTSSSLEHSSRFPQVAKTWHSSRTSTRAMTSQRL
jgi:hypothetical protein